VFNINKKNYFISYSQCGEDLIIDFIRKNILNLEDFTYLDIGANDPFYINNTALFYKLGYKGVLIEPDIKMFNKLKRKRPKDKVLKLGVAEHSGDSVIYIMEPSTLNTCSFEEAKSYERLGHKIIRKRKIQTKNINSIIKENFESYPNFLSIDVEGLDYEVITSLDLEEYKIDIICIETLNYTENNKAEKNKRIIDYMESKKYKVYADTYINTIFIKNYL